MAAKKTATKKAEAKTSFNPVTAVRQAWLAGLGSYVKAYEDTKAGYEKLVARAKEASEAREGLVEELIEKGEKVEAFAEEKTKEARENVVKFAEPRIEKIRSLIPTAEKSERVEELEAEIAKLNKKIATLSKKTTPAAKPAAKKPVARKAPAKAAATAAKTAAAKTAAPEDKAEATAAPKAA